MALSGTFNSAEYGNNTKIQLQCSWSAVQNVAENYSTVTVTAVLKYWSLEVSSRTGSIGINGSSQNISVGGIDDGIKGSYYYRTIMTRSLRVDHNEDGTKTCALSAYYPYNGEYSGVWVDALSASANVTLDKIDRNPESPSVVSASGTYGNKVGVGDQINIQWSDASGVITGYEVEVKRGTGEWSQIAVLTSSDTSGSTNWTLTGSNTQSGNTVQFRVRAMNGSLPSDWAYSNNLTITGKMMVKASNAWQTGTTYIKINGNWVRAKRVWIKIGGTWTPT